jgi:hypothetical protein
MRRTLIIGPLIVLLLSSCSNENTGIYTEEGFLLKKQAICERWELFASTENLRYERDSLIQDLQMGFRDLVDITGEAKYVMLLNAADHYALTGRIDDGIVGRIGSYCDDLAQGKE